MIIDCTSDLHGHYPKLEGGDLLIVAGDLTARDTPDEYICFCEWILKQNYSKKIVIAGNHDSFLQKIPDFFKVCGYAEYLCDSGTEFEYEEDDRELEESGSHPTVEKRLKIWGSPWTKTFPGMNPHCKAFTVDTEEELAEKFALIPEDVDILITHSPPLGIFDRVQRGKKIENVGSLSLCSKIGGLHNLKLHVFGHVHDGYGSFSPTKSYKASFVEVCEFISVNASHVNERYEPVNKPIRIEL